jgi:hypothetical protein
MLDPSRQENAQEVLQELRERRDALSKEAYERSANSTFTVAFGERMGAELERLDMELCEFRRAFTPSLEEVDEEVLGGRLLMADDYREFMPKLQIEIRPEGPLPFNIIEVLNRECPVYGKGERVGDTHILAWIPDNLSLRALSDALGGRAGNVLWSDWFIKDDPKLADLTLSACGKGGHWALIPDESQDETKQLNFNDSVAALKGEYVQADVISFSAALLLHAVKLRQSPRLYRNSLGWCQDPRQGTDLGKLDIEALYGGGGPYALCVGNFNALGLTVDLLDSGRINLARGCAALWNFSTKNPLSIKLQRGNP